MFGVCKRLEQFLPKLDMLWSPLASYNDGLAWCAVTQAPVSGICVLFSAWNLCKVQPEVLLFRWTKGGPNALTQRCFPKSCIILIRHLVFWSGPFWSKSALCVLDRSLTSQFSSCIPPEYSPSTPVARKRHFDAAQCCRHKDAQCQEGSGWENPVSRDFHATNLFVELQVLRVGTH